jgi:hypothetical protein
MALFKNGRNEIKETRKMEEIQRDYNIECANLGQARFEKRQITEGYKNQIASLTAKEDAIAKKLVKINQEAAFLMNQKPKKTAEVSDETSTK